MKKHVIFILVILFSLGLKAQIRTTDFDNIKLELVNESTEIDSIASFDTNKTFRYFTYSNFFAKLSADLSNVFTTGPHTIDTNTQLTEAQVDAYANNNGYSTGSHFSPSTLFSDYGFTDNSTNWNTAYGWGNHASAGYSTGSHTVETDPNAWKKTGSTTVTNPTISGDVTFDGNLNTENIIASDGVVTDEQGKDIYINTGSATLGNAVGGSLFIDCGTGNGTGKDGSVYLGTQRVTWLPRNSLYATGSAYFINGYISGNNVGFNWGTSSTSFVGSGSNNSTDYIYYKVNTKRKLFLSDSDVFFGGNQTGSPTSLSGYQMKIDVNGNLGVGDDIVPTEKLHVAGNGLFTGTVEVANATADGHALNRITADGRYSQGAHTTDTFALWDKDYNDLINAPTIPEGGTDDQIASEVPNTPSGNLAATDVQGALNELQTDVDAIGPHTTDHTALSNIGTNSHTAIDNHIASGTVHYTQAAISITESQVSDLSHTVDTNTQLNETQVDAFVANNGYSTGSHFSPSTLLSDYSFTDNSTNWNTAFGWGNHASAGYSTGAHTTDTNTQLSEAQVDTYVSNNGYSTGAHTVDTNTQLSQAQVGTYATNEGFIKSYTESDPNAWQKSGTTVVTNPTINGNVTHTGNIYVKLEDSYMGLDASGTHPRFGLMKKSGYAGMFASSNNADFIIGQTDATSINPSDVTTITTQFIINSSDGSIEAPTMSIADITGGDPRVLTTKEFSDSVYSKKSELSVVTNSNTSITIDSGDFGTTIYTTSASAVTITIPDTLIPVNGQVFSIVQWGAGTVTVQAGGTTTINLAGTSISPSAATKGIMFTHIGTDTDDWHAIGDFN